MKDSPKLTSLLQKRKDANALRQLSFVKAGLIDFSSNDYLGLARNINLKKNIEHCYREAAFDNGSTGSRLITGNNELIEHAEDFLASLFGQEASIIFNSGYMANLAYFSSIPQRGDTIIYDELVHACIKDGCRLSLAKRYSFKHNDLNDLDQRLSNASGSKYIVIESVYSMDGDMAPIEAICKLAERHGAFVVVDEAHATGIWGNKGQGLVQQLDLQKRVSAVIYTFGKAMGIHGACIAGSKDLKNFMINFSRPFIYTTAPGSHEIISIKEAFKFRAAHPEYATDLLDIIEHFNNRLPEFTTPSAIKAILIGGNSKTKALSQQFQQEGVDVRAILSPTVKEGTERLRICLHSFNTEKEIDFLCDILKANCPELFN